MQVEGAGIFIIAENAIIKNNIASGNNFGIEIYNSTDCIVEDNVCDANLLGGIINNVSPILPLLPNVGNEFYRNEAEYNNGNDYFGVPFVVSTSAIGATGTAVSPWVNLAP